MDIRQINFGGIAHRVTVTVAFLVLLVACETTTTGSMTETADAQRALQDYIRLAVAYYDEDDMVGARRHINNALAIDPRSADAQNVLALVLQREGDLDLADQTFRRALAEDRDNSRVRNNYAAFLFSQQRYQDAYEQLTLVSNDPGYEGRAMAFENLGRAALMLERADDAEYAFQRALQINGDLYLSALELAGVRLGKGDQAGARIAFGQYLTIREFYGIPYDARSLWIGIQLERLQPQSTQLDIYVRLLTALFQDSPEYRLYQGLTNGN